MTRLRPEAEGVFHLMILCNKLFIGIILFIINLQPFINKKKTTDVTLCDAMKFAEKWFFT